MQRKVTRWYTGETARVRMVQHPDGRLQYEWDGPPGYNADAVFAAARDAINQQWED